MRDTLHSPYEIVLKETADVCPRGKHKVSFFEFVYIVSGTGIQHINRNTISYKPGHLFLLTPDDQHSFVFNTTTQLFFIRFSNAYVNDETGLQRHIGKVGDILKNANKAPGCVLTIDADKRVLKSIVSALIHEHENASLYSEQLIHQYVQTILVIVARNLMEIVRSAVHSTSDRKIHDILQYIHENIYTPDRLKGVVISDVIGISETYLGRYFKKETNETLGDYIMKYKLKLIENRLTQSDMRINEIADEFGFTDKSHLNRFFKKLNGKTPSAFRNA